MKIIRKFAILKTSLFSWDIIPNLSEFCPNDDEIHVVNIEVTRLFQTQINKHWMKLGFIDFKRVKMLRKEIRNGAVLDSGDLPNENVHILTGGGKGKRGNSLLVSKDINMRDRLTYRVYKIEHATVSEIDKDGKEIIKKIAYQKVVLESCIGHQANGQGDYYNNLVIRNQFNRKRHKDNNSGRYKKK